MTFITLPLWYVMAIDVCCSIIHRVEERHTWLDYNAGSGTAADKMEEGKEPWMEVKAYSSPGRDNYWLHCTDIYDCWLLLIPKVSSYGWIMLTLLVVSLWLILKLWCQFSRSIFNVRMVKWWRWLHCLLYGSPGKWGTAIRNHDYPWSWIASWSLHKCLILKAQVCHTMQEFMLYIEMVVPTHF